MAKAAEKLTAKRGFAGSDMAYIVSPLADVANVASIYNISVNNTNEIMKSNVKREERA
jgi:hypothetical protein